MSTTYTPGQVGAASVPDAHTSREVPGDSWRDVDQVGDDVALTHDGITAGGIRGFRSAARGAAATGDRQIEQAGDPLASVHARPGEPDRRRTDEQERGHPRGEIGHEATPERYDNSLSPVVGSGRLAPPARPRQGWTGADPHRTSVQRRPLMLRLFDKGIAEHPGATDKIPQEAPRARVSRVVEDLPDGRPSPGGWFGNATPGVALARSTFRTIPGQWAEALVVGAPDEPAVVAAPTAQHARGFRR